MARRTDRKIEDVRIDNLNATYELYMTPEYKFKAMFNAGGDRHFLSEADTAAEAKRLANPALKELLSIEWYDAIKLNVSNRTGSFNNVPEQAVIYHVDRCQVGYSTVTKTWREEKWDHRGIRRVGDTLSFSAWRDGRRVELPVPLELPFLYASWNYVVYSEERWAAIEALNSRMDALRAALKSFLSEGDLVSIVQMANRFISAQDLLAIE